MLRLVFLSVTILLLPSIAAAQPVTGPYLSGEGGVNFGGSTLTLHGATDINVDSGPLGIGAIGWGFGNGLRTELEGSYRSNDVAGINTLRVDGFRLPLTNVAGNVATEALMANVFYDIPVQPFDLPVQPYFGAGLGYEWSQFNTSGNGFGTIPLGLNNSVTGPDTVSFGNGSAFAYQAIAGLSVPIQAVPRLNLTLEYRFFGTANAVVPVARTIPGIVVNGAVPTSTTNNNFSLGENALLIGFRYSLGAP